MQSNNFNNSTNPQSSIFPVGEIFRLPRIFETDNLLADNSELLVYIKTPKGIQQVIKVDKSYVDKSTRDFADLNYHPFRLNKIVHISDGSIKLFFAEKS